MMPPLSPGRPKRASSMVFNSVYNLPNMKRYREKQSKECNIHMQDFCFVRFTEGNLEHQAVLPGNNVDKKGSRPLPHTYPDTKRGPRHRPQNFLMQIKTIPRDLEIFFKNCTIFSICFRPFSLFYLHFLIPYYALMNESLFGGCINIPWTLLEIKPVLAPTSKMPCLMYIVTQNSGPSGFFLISLCLMSVHPQVRGSLTSSPD